jgi:hypothetical protein
MNGRIGLTANSVKSWGVKGLMWVKDNAICGFVHTGNISTLGLDIF